MNLRGESSDGWRGCGSLIVKGEGGRRRGRRALVVLKAVEIHRAANISILTLAGGAG